jgi:hypothetical protein
MCFDCSKNCNVKALTIHKDFNELIGAVFGLGGGFTLPDSFKPYWLFEYKRSLDCELVDEEMNTIKIPRRKTIAILRSIWDVEKKSGQLELF